MLLGVLKVTVLLGAESAPWDNADSWEWVIANRLRNDLWAQKGTGLGSDLPSLSCQGSMAGKQPYGEGGSQHPQGWQAWRAWAVSGASQSSMSPVSRQGPPYTWEQRPLTMPHFFLPGWGTEGLSGTGASPSPATPQP